MAVHNIKGSIAFSCDGCPEAIETETSDFNEARQEFRQAGWHSAKFGTWMDYCPDCAKAKGL